MPLLYYWRPDNYQRDLDWGAGFHLNQASARLHDVDIGDSLWAFTRDRDGHYVLAAELVVRAKTRNPAGFPYGSYRVWGDLERSRYFAVEGQPSIEPILRSLSVRINAVHLGQAFQGHAAVRSITPSDHALLVSAAMDLPLEPRARLLPEEGLEALASTGGDTYRFINEEVRYVADTRRQYLVSVVRRIAGFAAELRTMYGGRCQLCGWASRERYGTDLCEGHHLHWLSRGGLDGLDNLALLCPNHHRAVHRCDAPFDFSDMSFDFGNHRERVVLNLHLPTAACVGVL